ncbi:IPT/TIG domain-containing protein [Candidatus Korobacter versatilis]|uniref:IPT/TIG domain-containing protein n=1 Tax=Candidatus Korobacter versatilis TaxID=658062 RepID=UPI0011D06D2E|nr:IPT/TIG domain-containing protein [Candidatus Koribacter versatilis]
MFTTRRLGAMVAVIAAALFFASCSPIDLVCNSARPVPVIATITPSSATFADVQASLTLTVDGSKFVSSSIIELNGAPLATTVVSATRLQATITTTQIAAPGTAKISVHTPSNLSGDLGCTSGGDSASLTLTVT